MPGKLYVKILITLTILVYGLTANLIQANELKAVIAISSNLTGFSYPSHNCENKPSKPEKAPVLASYIDVDAYNIAVAQYNVRVALYNKSIKVYKRCIDSYIKSGNHDIETIRKKLNTALKEARRGN